MGKSPQAQIRDAVKKDDLNSLKAVLKAHPKRVNRAVYQAAQYGRAEIFAWVLSHHDGINLNNALATAVMPRATIPTHPFHKRCSRRGGGFINLPSGNMGFRCVTSKQEEIP